MKILYIAGESANWVINLCNEFCNQGHEVTCIVQQLDEYDKDNPVKEHDKLTRINVSYDRMFDRMQIDKIYSDMNVKYDLIFGSHSPISPVIKYLGEKYDTPWGVMLLDIPTDLMKKESFRMIDWKFWFKCLENANTIIFNTYVARDEYERYTGKRFEDENVIMYATNVPQKYHLSGLRINSNYVVSAFRLTEAKNASIITKALATMKEPFDQIVIGRDRGDLQNIYKIAQEHNVKVYYKSMCSEEEKFQFIENSFCLLYPQLSEYIGGLSPWEGMMIGKPVIVSDYRVLREMFKEHAIYVDPKDPVDVANKIIDAHDNYDEERLKKAYEFAKEEASFNTMASKMLKIFETAVRK